jgi:dihydroorotase
VIDPAAEWEFRAQDVRSKSKNSPFLGWKLRGRAILTVCRGIVRHSIIEGVEADA